jgi:pyridoxamine 5'-phosphate oxidase
VGALKGRPYEASACLRRTDNRHLVGARLVSTVDTNRHGSVPCSCQKRDGGAGQGDAVDTLALVDTWLESLGGDPSAVFEQWFADAVGTGMLYPEATALATATPAGIPSVRMVLLKGHDRSGFTFFTNRESRKAGELETTAHAALCFHWQPLERQVRVEGTVERISDEESAAYFSSRPRGSRISAWASPQSRPIEHDTLLRRLAEIEARHEGRDDIPLPPFWGGYRIDPVAIEFWQGRPNRLHDRARYERVDGGWRPTRLAP